MGIEFTAVPYCLSASCDLQPQTPYTVLCAGDTQLLSFLEKLWLSGKYREIVLFWGKPDARADSDPSAALGVLPEGRRHVSLILEAAVHPAQTWHLVVVAGKGVRLLERGGGWRELLPTQNKAASLWLAVWMWSAGLRVVAGAGGGGEWLLFLTSSGAFCQMHDRRAVSFSPSKWRGSRSFFFFFNFLLLKHS